MSGFGQPRNPSEYTAEEVAEVRSTAKLGVRAFTLVVFEVSSEPRNKIWPTVLRADQSAVFVVVPEDHWELTQSVALLRGETEKVSFVVMKWDEIGRYADLLRFLEDEFEPHVGFSIRTRPPESIRTTAHGRRLTVARLEAYE